MDCSWHTSTQQRGRNTITSGGSSSTWMPQPSSSANKKGLMVFGSKPNMLPSLGKQSQDDIIKIMADKGLKTIMLTEPKRVERILRNRRSAELSAQRKKIYLSDLQRKVQQLEQQKRMLTAQVHSLQSTTILLRAEEHEMAMKLHGFQQQTQQMDARNETLNAEVRRLKLSAGEIVGSDVQRNSYQEMSPQMTQYEQIQIQNHQPAAQFQEEEDELTELERFFMQ